MHHKDVNQWPAPEPLPWPHFIFPASPLPHLYCYMPGLSRGNWPIVVGSLTGQHMQMTSSRAQHGMVHMLPWLQRCFVSIVMLTSFVLYLHKPGLDHKHIGVHMHLGLCGRRTMYIHIATYNIADIFKVTI